MTTFVILVLAVLVVVVLVWAVGRGRDGAAETHSEANPLDPRVDAVWHRADRPPRELRRAEAAVRHATPEILDLLRHRGEPPQLIVYSHEFVFTGLLVITPRRSRLFGGASGSTPEVEHDGARTRIMQSGQRWFVEIANGGRIIHFGCSAKEECQLICGVLDCWADNPDYVAHPGVIVSPRLVRIPEDFYADLLRTAGRPMTATNLRSLHERVGMMLHIKAFNLLRGAGREDDAQRLTNRAGRPDDDSQLPAWASTVLESWALLQPNLAYSGAFALAQVRSTLLETTSTDGYFAGDPDRPLCMWKNEWYEDDGRGAPSRAHPSVAAGPRAHDRHE